MSKKGKLLVTYQVDLKYPDIEKKIPRGTFNSSYLKSKGECYCFTPAANKKYVGYTEFLRIRRAELKQYDVYDVENIIMCYFRGEWIELVDVLRDHYVKRAKYGEKALNLIKILKGELNESSDEDEEVDVGYTIISKTKELLKCPPIFYNRSSMNVTTKKTDVPLLWAEFPDDREKSIRDVLEKMVKDIDQNTVDKYVLIRDDKGKEICVKFHQALSNKNDYLLLNINSTTVIRISGDNVLVTGDVRKNQIIALGKITEAIIYRNHQVWDNLFTKLDEFIETNINNAKEGQWQILALMPEKLNEYVSTHITKYMANLKNKNRLS